MSKKFVKDRGKAEPKQPHNHPNASKGKSDKTNHGKNKKK